MSDSGDSLAGPGFLPAPPPAGIVAGPAPAAGIAHEAEIAPPGPGRGPGGGGRADEALPLRIMDHALTGAWALRSFLELGALPGAVPCARLHARLVLREWELTALSEDIELLVSELVTNGLQASGDLPQAAGVAMWLLADATRVLILVRDASPRPPVRMDVGADAERGRGLLLVEALSHRWGWHPADDGGKVVWALAMLPLTGDRAR